MFNSMNKIHLIGKTSWKFPPELKVTPSGTAVLRFSMSVVESYKDKTTGEKKKIVEYFRIVMWGKLAELGERFIKMDTLIHIEGKVRTNVYTDKEGKEVKGQEVIANDFVLLDSTPYEDKTAPADPQEPVPHSSGNYDEDIPF